MLSCLICFGSLKSAYSSKLTAIIIGSKKSNIVCCDRLYSWLTQQTSSNSLTCSLKYFGEAVLRPLVCCARGQLPPLPFVTSLHALIESNAISQFIIIKTASVTFSLSVNFIRINVGLCEIWRKTQIVFRIK